MSCVYILYSNSTKKFYTGSSRKNDVSSRLTAHNTGKTRSTKNGRPWTVVIIEIYQNYTAARKREIFLKSGVGRKKMNEKFGFIKKL